MRTRALLTLVVVLACLAGPASGRDADTAPARWPQFRGPDSQGVAREGMKLPATFGPTSHVLWKTPLPRGHSSPCVWDDRLFLTGYDKEAQKLETFCLDRRDGKIIWRRPAPTTQIEKVHELNTPASATPATDGERVYVCFGSYGLLCYDRDGNEVWKRPLPPIQSLFGSGTSPVLAGDVVLLNSGKPAAFTLLALDRRTGKTVWEQDRPRGFSNGLWSTPVVRHTADGDEVLVTGGGRVVAYRLADGAERWRVTGLPTVSMNTPAVGDGLLFVSLTNPFGEGDNVIKLPPFDEALKQDDKNGDGKIGLDEIPEDRTVFGRGRADKVGDWNPLRPMARRYDNDRDGALDRQEWQSLTDGLARIAEGLQLATVAVRLDGNGDVSQTHVAWKQTKSVPEVPSPLYYQGRVYLVSERGVLTCRDAKTGAEKYRTRLPVRGTCYASPIACDGKVIAACDGGVVVVFKAGDKYEELAKIDFEEGVYATPALVDGKVYLRTDRNLYAFGE
jgi:outer membrane protein assembly factor BamB